MIPRSAKPYFIMQKGTYTLASFAARPTVFLQLALTQCHLKMNITSILIPGRSKTAPVCTVKTIQLCSCHFSAMDVFIGPISFLFLRHQVYPVFSSILNTLSFPHIFNKLVSKVVNLTNPLDSTSLKTSNQVATSLFSPKILPRLSNYYSYMIFFLITRNQKQKSVIQTYIFSALFFPTGNKPPKHYSLSFCKHISRVNCPSIACLTASHEVILIFRFVPACLHWAFAPFHRKQVR